MTIKDMLLAAAFFFMLTAAYGIFVDLVAAPSLITQDE